MPVTADDEIDSLPAAPADDEALRFDDTDDDDAGAFERFKDPRVTIKNAHKRAQAVAQLTESAEELERGFETTYTPSRHEKGFLMQSLRPFYEQSLICDVLFSVKGGKEASVYCCRTHPKAEEALGMTLIAAKVYRPRQLRNLRNDALYREGRPILTADGRAAKKTDHRLMRAIGKKTDFGVSATHTSWLMYEHTTLQKLYDAGASVPRPIAAAENALLMEYVGDETRGAPTLIEVALDPADATRAFADVVRTLRVLFAQGVIHGDLSAYNVLWDGLRAVVIDFPQVVKIDENPHAEMILSRDLERVCDYFSRYGIANDPNRLRQSLEVPIG
jgi:RIO kinase 1